jgi:hypothetical protein
LIALTREESTHAKCRVEASFFRNSLVLETVLDVQRVREDDGLFIGDALAVVKLAHHLDEVGWVAGVLADTGVDLGIGLGGLGVIDVDIGGDGGIRGSIALDGSCADGFAEGV